MKTMIRKWESLPESRGIRPCKRKTLYYQQLRRSPLGILSIREKLQLDFALYTEGLVFEPEHKKTNLGAMTMRMQKSRWIAAMAVLVAAVVMGSFSASDALAQKGGKGGGGGTPPVLPNMAYEVKFLPIVGSAIVEDMNRNLQIVGWTAQSIDGMAKHDGFLYDHGTGLVRTLGDLISLQDMTIIAGKGFTQSKFRGINDSGLLVGYVGNVDYSKSDGLIIDLASRSLTLTSTLGYSDSYLLHVNNSGSLVGGYFADNVWWNTFVATYTYNVPPVPPKLTLLRNLGKFYQAEFRSRLTKTGIIMLGGDDSLITSEYEIALDSFAPVSNRSDGIILSDVDSRGLYVGTVKVALRKNVTETYPAVYDPSLIDGVIWQSSQPGRALRLNDRSTIDRIGVRGDVLISGNAGSRSPLQLYSPASGNLLSIDDLLDPIDTDRAWWLQFDNYDRGAVMTEKRADTNFGAIAGSATGGLVPYLLIPKPFVRP